jgi:hypothetical protein
MAIQPGRAYPWGDRFTLGNNIYKNIYSGSFGYTQTSKMVASASATAVMAATSAATSIVTVTSGLTDPDVPRNLTVTPGGTTADVRDSVVRVNGTNIEGKPIYEDFRFASATSSATTGSEAFRTVTSVVIGQQGSANVTFSVGTGNKLGINHRLFNQNTTVKVYTSTAAYGALTLQAAPTVVSNEGSLEFNTVTPATVPNGSLIYSIFYYYDNWALAPINDEPAFSTTTSTSSTSSSTSSTTITTSTSSTSTSFSSTSTSSTSTSLSTSSTSSSTTTAP